ncbi:adenine nucleotide alpha hydrolase [Gillisia sp. M10.2A]|uniref:Adenine nucleotide alpha hydrolase n=1 Tax=Gillisia lutea TaxID=2909668 RepID=A0ABS9EIX6_9FLAO|nr:adenine nucleotide alpha hydrolase [Gillisia lutea]MCF4102805.1 adenine nucleotide alpha hydrolase [Gillisia lutea]
MKKAYLNWSSGKDAAFCLYKIQQAGAIKIEKLLTTVNSEVDRVSMHGLRSELLKRQAESIGLPLHIIELNGNVSMQTYSEIMNSQVFKLKEKGFTHSVFGDIFLEDLKEYREQQLAEVGIEAVFPLWKKDTRVLLKEFIEAGFKAITVCVNSKYLDKTFCRRIIDQSFLEDLPEGVDACGENGEFHSFVYDGPNFKYPIKFEVGEMVERKYASKDEDDCFTDKTEAWDTAFWFCDLIPK